MTILTLILQIVFGLLLILIVFFFIFKDHIMSFFYPENFIKIEFLNLDNSIKQFLLKKPHDLKFQYKKGWYNLFDTSSKKKVINTIYREGRFSKAYYKEGNENQLDFRHLEITGNPQLDDEILKQKYDFLWTSDKSSLEKFLPYIIIGILIFIAIVLLKK